MKKIIVPIDFSETSEYALETASIIAKKQGAEILALHMLELSHSLISQGIDDLNAETVFYIKLAEKKFETILKKPYLKGIKITPIIKHFKVFKEVDAVATEHDADLIIIGSHGTSGIKEFFIGSNAEKVVRYSHIPVLVIKYHPILQDFNTAVFACDFSDEAVRPYINATNMFKKLDMQPHLLYVNLPSETFLSTIEMEKKVARFLKKADGNLNALKQVYYVNDYTVEQGVLNFANVMGADVIAVATHGKTGLAHFFEGSISEDITNHSTLPVMTFKM